MSKTVKCRVSPSLALIKYWGKLDLERNIPATSSLAINLKDLITETVVEFNEESEKDIMILDGEIQEGFRYNKFFNNLRSALKINKFFKAVSTNNFPSSAGLASSSSGFAALAAACTKLCDIDTPIQKISELALIGSASAARPLFGGFVLLPAGSSHAQQLYPADHWPELRIIIVEIDNKKKKISSTSAMEQVKKSSAFYASWVDSSERQLLQGLKALKHCDLEKLGIAMQKSYMRMFASMLAAYPPILYWLPDSIGVIHLCRKLRDDGISAWETMDAGPQVKILCLKNDTDLILNALKTEYPKLKTTLTSPGPGAAVE